MINFSFFSHLHDSNMLKSNINRKSELYLHDIVLKRYVRSARIVNWKRRDVEKNNVSAGELTATEEKEDTVRRWEEEDLNKLSTWTPWRRKEENRFAKRKLPLPMSLTGFGDGAKPRYWSYKIRRAITDWLKMKEKDELQWHEKISPAIRHVLSSTNPDALSDSFKPLQQKLLASENESKELVRREDPDEAIQFPFELLDALKTMDEEDKDGVTEPKFPSGVLDQEYKNFLDHHNFVQHLAKDITKIPQEEYPSEIREFGALRWRRNYGSPDPNIPSSTIPCGGCGAHLHCRDQAIPGYMPSEVFVEMSKSGLRSSYCQRCEYLQEYNLCLDATVSTQSYPEIISKLQNLDALVILMVDLTDFPASIWPEILDLVGKNKKIYVVGNKVDLLPKDQRGYLERIEESLKKNIEITASGPVHIWRTFLISAKTGYGVENFITQLMKDNNGVRDVYLVGCTNVGKSTLFNALLQSDLCNARENDLIQRATTSVWPGTTMNLLKFPLKKLRAWELKRRLERLESYQKARDKERSMRLSLWKQEKNPTLAVLSDRIGTTFRQEIPFTVESGHPMATRHNVPRPFNPDHSNFKNCKFFHDTPGSIYKEQLLTLLTTDELFKTLPRERIIPRTFSLWPAQTLFLAGLGRIDVLHAQRNILLTVFASHYLPIHVVFTDQARQFYQTFLGSRMLQVPLGGPERLKKWPPLLPKQVDLIGEGWEKSCADIVLSSAGWVSVTFPRETEAVLKAFTPECRGIFVRTPALLPFGVSLRGKKIEGTPCYEATKSTIEEIGDDLYDRKYKKDNKVEIPSYVPLNVDVKKRKIEIMDC